MSSTSVARPSYAAVLRIPYARRTFAAALLGRLSYGIVPLAVMLAVTRASGSYAVAGTVMALFSGTSVFLSPARAALIDRYGPRRALVPMAAAYTASLGLLTVVVWRPGAASPLVLAAVTAAAGACTPPLGPTMRAVWGRIAGDRALVQRAYSLDAVAEELLFVSGPLLVGVVVGFAPPALGIVVGAVLIAAGTAGFVSSPAVREVPPGDAREKSRGEGRRRVLRGIRRPVLAATGVGLALGAVELLVVAFADGRGHGGESVAWVLAALSAGSAVGGLANGAVTWRTAAGLRLVLLAAGLGLALIGAGLAPGLGTLAAAMAVAGLFVAPTITTAYLIADEAAAPGARVQAGAWVNTAVNAGITAGTAAAGVLVGRLSTGWCFAVTGAVTLLAALAVARGATRDGGAPAEEEVREARDGGAVRAV
ncbi:MFS transporter [Streptomyces viridochromogenes]|uniref:MFS transporter n=1 Tax=Streptomyces viridochromogenes TaxID=1938 RepID=UPI00069CFF4A|nr:MFS transporter [Streptomyces viridochromogenes]KOG18301.1 membrane protein [Streptomyces viridochromogenes]KOG27453.1 membrane protein [Streptomyces viridochromogenes]